MNRQPNMLQHYCIIFQLCATVIHAQRFAVFLFSTIQSKVLPHNILSQYCHPERGSMYVEPAGLIRKPQLGPLYTCSTQQGWVPCRLIQYGFILSIALQHHNNNEQVVMIGIKKHVAKVESTAKITQSQVPIYVFFV